MECIKIGDKATLYCADCLDVMRDMPAGSVDLILTDLPYGTTQCAWDVIIPFDKMWEGVKRVLKPNGVFVTTASQPFTSKLVMSNIDLFKYEWIWEKDPTGFLDCETKPMKSHENVLVFSVNGNSEYNPQKILGKYHGIGGESRYDGQARVYGEHSRRRKAYTNTYYPRSILRVKGDPERYQTLKDKPFKTERHPTQKPVKLYTYMSETYTISGNVILDICMGSGTTGVACMQLGRKFIGVEIDPNYFAIAEKRIRQAAAQMVMPI